MFNLEEMQLLKLLAAMSDDEIGVFLDYLISSGSFKRLLDKVNFKEQRALCMYLQAMILQSGRYTNTEVSVRDEAGYYHYSARFDRSGKMNIHQVAVNEHSGHFETTNRWRGIHPYDMVQVRAGGQEYRVPAFMLYTDKEYILGRKTGIETLWGAIQGEFNEDPTGEEIVLDMIINFIPIVGQLCDARDIIACMDKICNKGKADDVMVWITLILVAVGCIPGAGDVVKAVLKSILKGADDVAIGLMKALFKSDDVLKCIDDLLRKFDDMIPAIRDQIMKWADEAAGTARYNLSNFFSSVGRMIDEAVTKINDAIVGLRRKIDNSVVKSVDEAPTLKIYANEIEIRRFNPEGAQQIIEKNYGFNRQPNSNVWKSVNTPGVEIEYFADKGWVYRGADGREVQEFTILNTHSSKSNFGTPTGNGPQTFMQSHHGIQDAWANTLPVECGYRSDDMPTILLRDSYAGSPHHKITGMQGKNYREKTYAEIRRETIEQFNAVQVPQEIQEAYMEKVDVYFRKLYENLKSKDPDMATEIFGIFD